MGIQFYGTNADEIIDGTGGNDHLAGLGGTDIINGGNGSDYIAGGSGDDVLYGGNGLDQIDGGVGDDVLNGGAGDDHLTGGPGDDVMRGGDGNDDYFLGNDTGDVIIDTGGIDAIHSTVSRDLRDFDGIEALYIDGGSRRGTTAIGTDGNDHIVMSSWLGVVDGGAGDDTLEGDGTGSEIFIGGMGRDVIYGGEKDLGPPWWGQDLGIDRFDFRTPAESAVGNQRDVIQAFLHSDTYGGDQVNLGFMDANTTIAGNQAFVFVGSAFTGAAGELTITEFDVAGSSMRHQIIAGDVDGDGVADFEIEVQVCFQQQLTLDNDIIL